MAGPVSVAPWGNHPPAGVWVNAGALRLWRGFANARVGIAATLLLALASLSSVTPGPSDQWTLSLSLCAVYLVAGLGLRLLGRAPGRRFDSLWTATIGIDLLTFASLQYLQAGGLNFAPLFAVPVLMAAVLGTATIAFGTAAVVALLLLADAWVHVLDMPYEVAPRFLQAGLTGLGYFAVAALANQLAARLAREEEKLRASEEATRLQALVNELVIETLADGIVVLDEKHRVLAVNPTASHLLGQGTAAAGFSLSAQPSWEPLIRLAERTFQMQAHQVGEATLGSSGEPGRRVLVRTRLAVTDSGGARSLCVLFLEDLREMEARIRTEKLAAMGRMSAAVAHEIRNPLAAITQANALLDEELSDPAQRQLSALVQQNAQRLARIVEDVLDVSRVRQQGASDAAPLALGPAVTGVCRDWQVQTQNTARLRVGPAPASQVLFDAEHLRRVLVNLLDNAARHAGPATDSIQVAMSIAGSNVALHVWSDGAPLEPTVRLRLFEPFFSSESRSSGLGLFICRELCERHGAHIGYRRTHAPLGASREGNEFFVQFRSAGERQAVRAGPAARIQG